MRSTATYTRRSSIVVMLLVVSSTAMAQQGAVPDTSELSIRPYGSFRGHMALYNDELELQQNGSRIGFDLRFKVKKVTYFATSELAINMFRNDVSFSASASTDGGFLTLDQGQANQVFATRLGYIGADFGKGGQLTIGKQWGAYYDVSGYTDRFNVFGGQASNSYNGGTDGGLTGTGRADQAVVYRNTFGPLSIAGQLQFRSVTNNEIVDNLGGSVQLQLMKGLKVGGGYMQTALADFFVENTAGMDGDPSMWVAGATYSNAHWDIAATFSGQTNGDFATVLDTSGTALQSVVYDGTGAEAYIRYKHKAWAFSGGFNYYLPTFEDNDGLAKDFTLQYVVLGAEYHPGKYAYLYAEGRLDDSITANGLDGLDVFTVGLRLDVDRLYSRKFVHEPWKW